MRRTAIRAAADAERSGSARLIDRITPHEAIVRVRLQRARQRLTETELRLQVVAERSGFCYAENMSITVRKRTDVTPGLLRAQQRGHDRGPARGPRSLA
jgi:AraC-like DNA-binding protein